MNNGIIDTDEEGSQRLSKLGEQRGGGVAQRGRLEGTGTEGAKGGRARSFTRCVRMFCLFKVTAAPVTLRLSDGEMHESVVWEGVVAGCGLLRQTAQ